MNKITALCVSVIFYCNVGNAQTNNDVLQKFISDPEFNSLFSKSKYGQCDTIWIIDTFNFFTSFFSSNQEMVFAIKKEYWKDSLNLLDKENELLSWRCKIQVTKIVRRKFRIRIHFYNKLSELTGFFEYSRQGKKLVKQSTQVGQF